MMDIIKAREIVSTAIGEAELQKQQHLVGVSSRKIIMLPMDVVECLINSIDKFELGDLKDINGSDGVEVKIRGDGNVLWVNTVEGGCILRICKIKSIVVEDERWVK
jgi:hypothetical protein